MALPHNLMHEKGISDSSLFLAPGTAFWLTQFKHSTQELTCQCIYTTSFSIAPSPLSQALYLGRALASSAGKACASVLGTKTIWRRTTTVWETQRCYAHS